MELLLMGFGKLGRHEVAAALAFAQFKVARKAAKDIPAARSTSGVRSCSNNRMKIATLLLTAVALLFVQNTASAQSLASSAGSVRTALLDLFVVVDKKVDREYGRERTKQVIQQARAEMLRVQTLAEAGAPRSVVGPQVDRARDVTVAALGLVRGNGNETVRANARFVRDRLSLYDQAWDGYGGRRGGYDSRGYGGYDRRR
jgi:hypothetical protein